MGLHAIGHFKVLTLSNAYSLPLVRCHKQLPGDTVNVVNNGRVEWYVPDNHDEPRGLFDVVIVRFY